VLIDAHQHYWKVSSTNFGWPTRELDRLYRDFLPTDLAPHLARHRIEKSIVVQAAASPAETEFLLDLCSRESSVAGVVGWLDPRDPESRKHFRRYGEFPKLVGVRVMLQDIEDCRGFFAKDAIHAFAEYAEMGTPIDLLVRASQLPVLIDLLRLVPNLRAVVDHIAKPDIAQGVMDPWRDELRAVADYPNVYCKLSGMVTEADRASWQTEDFRPYVAHVLRAFGPERVLYGSDWPVCLLAGTYDAVWDLAHSCLPDDLTEAQRTGIFGDHAALFYKLGV